MTRVALIADIHSNVHGLEAVLADIDRQAVDALYDLGDVVNYGPSPNEAVDLLRARGIPSIQGNHDRKVLAFGPNRREYARTKRVLSFASFKFTYETLREDNREFLRRQPAERDLELDGVSLHMIHTVEPGMRALLDRVEDDAEQGQPRVVAWGHSHVPQVKPLEGTLYVNAGTAGRGSRGDVRASYALLDLDSDRATAQIRWVPYDLEPTLEALIASPLPDAFTEMFRQGVLLSQVANLDTGELLSD